MDMDMMSADAPLVRIWPVRGQPGLSPALLWDDLVPGLASAEGGVLACPWCGLSSNLHLARIYYATPAPDYYPSFGVDIDVMAAMVTFPGVEAAQLHGDANTGVMLTVEVWCDNGCRGRLEFRQHIDTQEGLDVVVLNLEELSGFPPDYFDPDDVDSDDGSGPITVGQADPTEPPF